MKGGVTRYPRDSGELGAEPGVDPQPEGEVQVWWVEGVGPDRTWAGTCTLAGVAKSTGGDEELTGGAASTPGCSA